MNQKRPIRVGTVGASAQSSWAKMSRVPAIKSTHGIGAPRPYPMSNHYDGTSFRNTDASANVARGVIDFLTWRLTADAKAWPARVANTARPQLPARVAPGTAYVTLINHASELIQVDGLNIITDPIFSERASPLRWAGPKRVRAPGIPWQQLPKIDVVLISHNHYDHLDLPTAKALWQRDRPLFIVPLGNANLLKGVGVARIIELDWWQDHGLAPDQTITMMQAQHWSARGIADRNRALWGGFLVRAGGLKIFFAGDTGYNSHFREIYQRYGAIDVSILPIGGYEPRWFMKPQHMNPAEAVQAHRDLYASLSVGMHFGTFQLTDEGIDEPVLALQQSVQAQGLSPTEFLAPSNGETAIFTRDAALPRFRM